MEERGYDALTVNDLCERADTSRDRKSTRLNSLSRDISITSMTIVRKADPACPLIYSDWGKLRHVLRCV